MSAAELAQAIERMTGLDPCAYAAERIDAQACADDEASVRRLAEIARLGGSPDSISDDPAQSIGPTQDATAGRPSPSGSPPAPR